MRFGLALPHYDTSLAGRPASWDGVVEVARTAEAVGFDSVWVSDHLFLDWGKYGGPETRQGALECFTTLAGLAAVTEKVRLGSLALCNDLRNPGLVAKMIATLDAISEGRAEVTLGAGWYEPEYVAAGIDFEKASVRIGRLGEAVRIVQRLLEGEELSFTGDHYSMSGAIVRPGPKQKPRPGIAIGGKGDLLLTTVAEVADGWNFSWLGSLAAYEERLAFLERACADRDRDPSTVRRSVGAYVLVGKDDADIARRLQRLVTRTPEGVLAGANGSGSVSLEDFRSSRVAGNVEEVVETFGRLDAMGVEEAILTVGALPFQLGDLEDVELIGSEVITALR